MENSFQNIIGLKPREWRPALTNYLLNNTLDAEVHERMSLRQKDIINEVKLSLRDIQNYEQ